MTKDAAAVQAKLTEHVQREAGIIASRMRRAADDVERHAERVRLNLYDMKLDHANVADEVARDVSSLIGNTDLGALIRAAATADRFVRSPEGGAA